MNAPVLVTGAAGFAGGHLIEHLAPSHEVVAWARGKPPAELAPLASWQQIDMLDRDRVRTAVRELRPRTCYHCAGVSGVDTSAADPARALAANVLGTHLLLDALRRAAIPCRVLVTGSAAVYAPSPDPLREDGRLAPDTPYALSKFAQEGLSLRAAEEDGLEVVLARSFNHTGPRQTPYFVTASIARQIALAERGAIEPVLRVGNLDPARDLSDIRDVVGAYVALAKAGVPGEVYNVASGTARTIRSIVDQLVALASVRIRVEIDAQRVRPTDRPILVGDASKLRALTGWKPLVPFEAMLRDLLDYWRRAATV